MGLLQLLPLLWVSTTILLPHLNTFLISHYLLFSPTAAFYHFCAGFVPAATCCVLRIFCLPLPSCTHISPLLFLAPPPQFLYHAIPHTFPSLPVRTAFCRRSFTDVFACTAPLPIPPDRCAGFGCLLLLLRTWDHRCFLRYALPLRGRVLLTAQSTLLRSRHRSAAPTHGLVWSLPDRIGC